MFKKQFKKALSLIITAALLIGIIPSMSFAVSAKAVDISSLAVGDIIEFGSYPQSKVEDKNIIAELDRKDKSWISYDYYLGAYSGYIQSGSADGTMYKSDYMRYADINYNGEKYRAVVFDMYRPYDTMRYEGHFSDQEDNGYFPNIVYYFKYEPLKWRVLDPQNGFVCSDNAIDCVEFNGYIYRPEGESNYYSDPDCTNYASDYSTSEIREWLNNKFIYTAFNSEERFMIKKSLIETPSRDNDGYGCPEVTDKIFLLSVSDISNADYGFKSPYKTTDSARIMRFTDYAACQGLSCSETGYSANWVLRTPINSYRVCNVHCEGYGGNFISANETDYCGIVPAFNLKTSSVEYDKCGENAVWSYSEGTLRISGTGSVNGTDEYNWEEYNDSIEYIETDDGIISLPDGIFSGLNNLTEVCFGSGLQSIGQNAFANCPKLSNVSFMSNCEIGNGSFSDADSTLMLVYMEGCGNPEAFAKNNNIKSLVVSYNEENKTLSFNGGIDVKDNLSYAFLNKFLLENKESEYIFFDELDFHNIVPEQILIIDDEIDADINNTNLSLHNIYVNLNVIDEEGQHRISFEKMLELLKNGRYDAFKIVVHSDEQTEEQTFFEKVSHFFEQFFEDALKAISKVINFVTKLFKK